MEPAAVSAQTRTDPVVIGQLTGSVPCDRDRVVDHQVGLFPGQDRLKRQAICYVHAAIYRGMAAVDNACQSPIDEQACSTLFQRRLRQQVNQYRMDTPPQQLAGNGAADPASGAEDHYLVRYHTSSAERSSGMTAFARSRQNDHPTRAVRAALR